MIRAIAFDLDNTLVLRDGAFARYLQAECLLVPERVVDRATVAALDQRGHGPKGPLLAYLAETLGWPERDAESRQLRFSQGMLSSLVVDARVPRLLSRLQGRYPLALITNGTSRVQRGKLNRLGLTRYFDHILISEEIGVKKPERAVFDTLLAVWSLDPAEVAFVGDSPDKDVLGARTASLTPIWISEGRSWPLACQEPISIVSVHELEPVLAAIRPLEPRS